MADADPMRPLPPYTLCESCGRRHRSWRPGALCRPCVRRLSREPSELVKELRERRAARRLDPDLEARARAEGYDGNDAA